MLLPVRKSRVRASFASVGSGEKALETNRFVILNLQFRPREDSLSAACPSQNSGQQDSQPGSSQTPEMLSEGVRYVVRPTAQVSRGKRARLDWAGRRPLLRPA